MVLVEVQLFGTGTRYGLINQCRKRVKTKSQKDLGANSYVSSVTEEKLVQFSLYLEQPFFKL